MTIFKKTILVSAVSAVMPFLAVHAVEPAPLVFTQEQGGKYIYCNNHELIRGCDLADNSIQYPKFIMNNEALGPDNYTLFASFLNRTDIDINDKSSGARGVDIELDVLFKAESDTTLTIKNLGFEVPEHHNIFFEGSQYSTEDEWGCFSCWASYMRMPIKQINSGNVYEPTEFDEVTLTLVEGDSIWLSEYIKNYCQIPLARSVHIMTDFEITEGSCDVNIAAFRSTGTLKDRRNFSKFTSYGSYFRDKQYKGISDGKNEVTAKLSYTIDDSVENNTKLPVTVYNYYMPDGNTITDWYTHLNPRADEWSYSLCAESDMLSFKYYDPRKLDFYGSAVKDEDKTPYYIFDTKHTDISEYKKEYGRASVYIPNRELQDEDPRSYTCNLANYGVIYNYNISVTNNGNKHRYLIYKLATSSNNLVYVKDKDGNIMNDRVLSKGRKTTRISDDMACLSLPAQATSEYTVCVVLTPNYAGGMQNNFTISDYPSLIETYETERSYVAKDRYYTGREFYRWSDGKLKLSPDKINWNEITLPDWVMKDIRGNLNEFALTFTGSGYIIHPTLYSAGIYTHVDHLFRDVYLLDEDFNLIKKQTFGGYPKDVAACKDVYYVKMSSVFRSTTQFKWWDLVQHDLPCYNYGRIAMLTDRGTIKASADGKDFYEVVYNGFKPDYVDSLGDRYYFADGRTLFLSNDGIYWNAVVFQDKIKSLDIIGNIIISNGSEAQELPTYTDKIIISINDRFISPKYEPIMINDTNYIAAREFSKLCGADIEWNDGTVDINGKTIDDVILTNDLAYISLRDFTAAVGMEIMYDADLNIAYLK